MKNNRLNILLTNKEYLLLYNIIGYLFVLLFPYRSLPFTPYFQIIRRYLSSIFFFYPTPPPTSHVYDPLQAASVRHPRAAFTRCMIEKEKETQDWELNERLFCRSARNYSGPQFITPIPDREPIYSPYTCPTRDWVYEFHISYRSMISRPRLRSGH